MSRKGLVSLAVVVVVVIGLGVGGYFAFVRSSGPSSAERATCAALQDFEDDAGARANIDTYQADLQRAGQAANRGDNTTLAKQVAAARVALGIYALAYSGQGDYNPVVTAISKADNTCKDLGLPIRTG